MQDLKPIIAEIKARGQLTIPKKIREMGQLDKGRQLPLNEARREIKKILRQTGLSVKDVLAGISEEREALYEETYGKKTS
ncbi:MAG: hypothetical protein JRI80_20185 [Deltaproteobacteria bacterium]|nr:hypothetical protein [Deltaproteobacteria bacterium]